MRMIILVGVLSFWIASADLPANAGGGEVITLEQALQKGNEQVLKMGIDLSTVEVKVDEENKKWQEYLSNLASSTVPEFRSVAKRYGAKLHGHSYWSIFYEPKRVDGHGLKGGGATVLVEKRSGTILLAIQGE